MSARSAVFGRFSSLRPGPPLRRRGGRRRRFGPREPRTPTRLSVRELLCARRGVVRIRGRMEGGFRSLRPPRGSRVGLESDGIPRGGVSARPCRLPVPDADEPFGRLAIRRSGRPRSSSGSCASCRRQRFGGMHEHVPILGRTAGSALLFTSFFVSARNGGRRGRKPARRRRPCRGRGRRDPQRGAGGSARGGAGGRG
jgi:hypothetical protein